MRKFRSPPRLLPGVRELIREHYGVTAEHRKAVLDEAGHAPRSSDAICREVMKNIRKKKKTEVDFQPCLNDKQVPGSLPEAQEREPMPWDTMDKAERRKIFVNFLMRKINSKEKIKDRLIEKLLCLRRAHALDSHQQEQE
jgi:hypothetical protein